MQGFISVHAVKLTESSQGIAYVHYVAFMHS
jgi:hypothetical protein